MKSDLVKCKLGDVGLLWGVDSKSLDDDDDDEWRREKKGEDRQKVLCECKRCNGLDLAAVWI